MKTAWWSIPRRAINSAPCRPRRRLRQGLIRKAHAAYALGERATDDAALAERMGIAVHLTEGDVENIKLTTPEDMLLARQVILKREGQKEEKPMMRIGHGYDVHRLVENRKLILCGVEIPYALGLLGHSDADVALHALMDALLGAAALGISAAIFRIPIRRTKARIPVSCWIMLWRCWKKRAIPSAMWM